MDWRAALSNRSVVTVVGLVLLLTLTAWFAQRGIKPRRSLSDQAYFYDVSTGQVVAMPKETPSPTTLSGAEGLAYRAYVFSCGACSAEQWKVLFMVNEPAGAGVPSGRGEAVAGNVPARRMVARPPASPGEAPRWFNSGSAEAEQLTTEHLEMCSGNRASICEP